MKNAAAAEISETEIEITPEMIEAAESVLDSAYVGAGRYILTEDVIAAVFRAMILTARSKKRKAPAPIQVSGHLV